MLGARITAAVATGLAILGLAPLASAQAPQVVGPYDGKNPFRCRLQDVGTGTNFPDPGADPFCVEFDKTNQNVTGFGIVDFASQEPARVAAATTKCFYYQRDHWTGSIVQGSDPELWHWDGGYYFDRARGVGGVSVRNFRLGGQPQDASPYVPAAYRPYFDPQGGGGVEVVMDSGPDPSCATKVDTPAERDRVYGGRGTDPPCIPPGGALRGRRVGRLRLGMRRPGALRRLGPPLRYSHRIDRWCLIGKGELRARYGPGRRIEAILTSGRGQGLHGVARGDRVQRARTRLDLLARRRGPGGVHMFEVASGQGPRAWIGVARGRVRWVAIQRRGGVSAAALARLARNVP